MRSQFRSEFIGICTERNFPDKFEGSKMTISTITPATRKISIHTLDIEASGFGSASYPIEIGLLLADGTTYHSLIQPLPHWTHWSQQAESIHQIPRDCLLQNGKTISQVCREVNQLCAGKTLYSDCWVHDAAWLQILFGEAGISMAFRCSPVELLLKEENMAVWAHCKAESSRYLDIAPHRALNDAIIVSKTLEYFIDSTANIATENNGFYEPEMLTA